MPFRFSLETVLRFRRSQERAERLTLASVARDIAETDRRIEQCAKKVRTSMETLARELRHGLVANELHFQTESRRQIQAEQQSLLETRKRLEEAYRSQREAFERARQRLEMLEKVGQDQKSAWERAERRREQQRNDERFLLQGAPSGEDSRLRP